jgi:hypothetical protein
MASRRKPRGVCLKLSLYLSLIRFITFDLRTNSFSEAISNVHLHLGGGGGPVGEGYCPYCNLNSHHNIKSGLNLLLRYENSHCYVKSALGLDCVTANVTHFFKTMGILIAQHQI